MCTTNIYTLGMDRQVFWQASYLHSSKINSINKRWCNQNIHKINSDIEKAINIAKKLKDEYDQSKKKTRDYSGLKAFVVNELYVDDGVVRTRKTDSSNNQS